MNGFNLSNITDSKYGSTQVSAIYFGSSLIWQYNNTHDYSLDYLTIESLVDNNTISWENVGNTTTKEIYWSTDGINWTSAVSATTAVSLATLNTGEKLYLKGDNTSYAYNQNYYNKLNASGNFKVYGNIMSLLYEDNFIGETSLGSDTNVFQGLFRSNTYLVDASNLILPATTLTADCYNNLFYGCSSLIAAPTLPATTLGSYCYKRMFRDCTSLVNAPVLPATTLAQGCYSYMFYGCTSLVNAPVLPATILVNNCYEYMFMNCSSLNYIKAMYTSFHSSSTSSWVSGVASTGTFVRNVEATWSTQQDVSGIPIGWTLTHDSDNEYWHQYFTVESLENANGVQLKMGSSATAVTLYYSTDKENWSSITATTSWQTISTLRTGEKLYLKGTNTAFSTRESGNYANQIKIGRSAKIYGNILTMIYGDNFKNYNTISQDYMFFVMFSESWHTDAGNLILPQNTTTKCYGYMFNSCRNMTIAPTLPAKTLTTGCYNSMFRRCTSLNYVKALFTTDISSTTNYTNGWMESVPSEGTFVKNSNATWSRTGTSGIPSGWTVETE